MREGKKKFILALMSMSLCGATMHSFAADKTLYMAGFGGVLEEVFSKEILPTFERANQVKVEYVVGISASTLARLRAQKESQELDLVMLEAGPTSSAIEQDLCAVIKDKKMLDSTFKQGRWPEDKALSFGVVAAGLAYNQRYFDQKGWPAPTSWNDLREPKYHKKVMLPTFSSSFGLYAVSMLSRANGGSDENVDPGFAILSKEVAPNVVSFDPGPGKAAELYQTEQAVIGVWSNVRVAGMRAQGFPLVFVYPKEGAVSVPLTACVVKKRSINPLTEKLLAHIMSPASQIILAKSMGVSPLANPDPYAVSWIVPRDEHEAALKEAPEQPFSGARPSALVRAVQEGTGERGVAFLAERIGGPGNGSPEDRISRLLTFVSDHLEEMPSDGRSRLPLVCLAERRASGDEATVLVSSMALSLGIPIALWTAGEAFGLAIEGIPANNPILTGREQFDPTTKRRYVLIGASGDARIYPLAAPYRRKP
ncbi:extracellular solute-binding protein [bacterium]|nr:MAG: extracellular solute-binding protein [bacterium]